MQKISGRHRGCLPPVPGPSFPAEYEIHHILYVVVVPKVDLVPDSAVKILDQRVLLKSVTTPPTQQLPREGIVSMGLQGGYRRARRKLVEQATVDLNYLVSVPLLSASPGPSSSANGRISLPWSSDHQPCELSGTSTSSREQDDWLWQEWDRVDIRTASHCGNHHTCLGVE